MGSFRERVFGSNTSTDSSTTNSNTKQLGEDDGYLVMFVLDEKVRYCISCIYTLLQEIECGILTLFHNIAISNFFMRCNVIFSSVHSSFCV
jgi:hypothetical protein